MKIVPTRQEPDVGCTSATRRAGKKTLLGLVTRGSRLRLAHADGQYSPGCSVSVLPVLPAQSRRRPHCSLPGTHVQQISDEWFCPGSL